jgi:hypothetical protein
LLKIISTITYIASCTLRFLIVCFIVGNMLHMKVGYEIEWHNKFDGRGPSNNAHAHELLSCVF